MSEPSEKKESTGCKEFDQCLEYLYLMLDNEATDAQETYLKNHLESCMICFEQYEVEKHIKDLLKTRITKQPVPADLANIIRTKVFQSA